MAQKMKEKDGRVKSYRSFSQLLPQDTVVSGETKVIDRCEGFATGGDKRKVQGGVLQTGRRDEPVDLEGKLDEGPPPGVRGLPAGTSTPLRRLRGKKRPGKLGTLPHKRWRQDRFRAGQRTTLGAEERVERLLGEEGPFS